MMHIGIMMTGNLAFRYSVVDKCLPGLQGSDTALCLKELVIELIIGDEKSVVFLLLHFGGVNGGRSLMIETAGTLL